MDTIIRDKIVAFLEHNKLITNNQHGVCNNRSCLINLLEFFSYVYYNWDCKIPSDTVHLDFKKAFDKIPHR